MAEGRKERLAEALRRNLKRRKAQQRERADQGGGPARGAGGADPSPQPSRRAPAPDAEPD